MVESSIAIPRMPLNQSSRRIQIKLNPAIISERVPLPVPMPEVSTHRLVERSPPLAAGSFRRGQDPHELAPHFLPDSFREDQSRREAVDRADLQAIVRELSDPVRSDPELPVPLKLLLASVAFDLQATSAARRTEP
jgi:hypothetical protein